MYAGFTGSWGFCFFFLSFRLTASLCLAGGLAQARPRQVGAGWAGMNLRKQNRLRQKASTFFSG